MSCVLLANSTLELDFEVEDLVQCRIQAKVGGTLRALGFKSFGYTASGNEPNLYKKRPASIDTGFSLLEGYGLCGNLSNFARGPEVTL